MRTWKRSCDRLATDHSPLYFDSRQLVERGFSITEDDLYTLFISQGKCKCKDVVHSMDMSKANNKKAQ